MNATSGNDELPVSQDGPNVLLRVLVHAGAKRNRIIGIHDRALKMDIKAAPERGSANEALVQLCAHLFSKPCADIVIRHGHTSRNKLVLIRSCSTADLMEIIHHYLGSFVSP